MSDTKKLFKLVRKLQALAHEYGYADLQDATVQACYQAADEMYYTGQESKAEQYRRLGTLISDCAHDETEGPHEGDEFDSARKGEF